jgi:plastocyanin
MNTELRERAILPILIPLLAIVLTEILVFAMSRILLTAGEMPAVVIALAAALAILIGAAVIAARPRIKTGTILGLLTILGIGTIAAGALALQRGPAYVREEAANRPVTEVAAADLAFDTDELKLGADGTVIEFDNADSQPHNIAVYEAEDDLDAALFKGAIISAGQSATYEVGPVEPGDYYFHCDVHPTMNGTAVVAEVAAEGEGASEDA